MNKDDKNLRIAVDETLEKLRIVIVDKVEIMQNEYSVQEVLVFISMLTEMFVFMQILSIAKTYNDKDNYAALARLLDEFKRVFNRDLEEIKKIASSQNKAPVGVH